MKNYIDGSGVELEGFWKEGNQPQGFKHDDSVHFENHTSDDCDGSCRDNQECYCFDDCECSSCQLCTLCESYPDNCSCDECLTCQDCENKIDDCDCKRNYEKQEDCKNMECKNDDVCDSCVEICDDDFTNLQSISHDCDMCNNSQINCERDCSCECQCECSCDSENVGETSSPILKSINDVKEWTLLNYPDEHNSSCGLHCHTSFKNDKISVHVLASVKFHNYLNQNLRLWAKNRNINDDSRFFKRLDGMEYCKNEFEADDQLNGSSSNRYTQINFCAYNKFKTVEFRVGNMFDKKEITIEYLIELNRLINQYLNDNKPKTWKFNYNINDEISISLELKMIKTGLKIFAKGYGIEEKLKNIDTSRFNGYTLYDNYDDEDLNTNINRLFDNGEINLCFLRLRGLTNGKSMILPNVFTENQIEKYIHDLSVKMPMVLRNMRGLKICV